MKLTSWQVCETFVYPRFPLKGVCKNLLKLKTINYKFSCVYVNVGITEKKTPFHSVKLLSTLVAEASLSEMSYAPKLFMCPFGKELHSNQAP